MTTGPIHNSRFKRLEIVWPRWARHLLACGMALCVVGSVALGCGDHADDSVVVYDFIVGFPAAGRARNTTLIDIGTPAARPHILNGWYPHQRAHGKATTLLGRDRESGLEFFRVKGGPVEATFRCLRLAAGAMSVVVNGITEGRIRLKGGWHEYPVQLKKRAIRPGRNLLALRYSYRDKKKLLQSAFERRDAAVECDTVRFSSPGGSTPVPTVDNAAAELRIPVGEEVEYYVRAPGGSRITFEGPTALQATNARLEVWVQQDGGADARLGQFPVSTPGATSEHRVELPEAGSRFMRIVFRVVDGDGDGAGAEVISLSRPAIRAVPGHAPDAPPGTGRLLRVSEGQVRPTVIVYLIDTLRADYLGCYGNPKPVSPHIDALAADGVLFEHAVANAPWTKPSVASVFTGVWPGTHNVVIKGQSLPTEAVTLAELLGVAGFQTAAFVANGHVTDRFGFDQGFDRFTFLRPPLKGKRLPVTSDRLNALLLPWLGKRSPGQPLFLYVHTVDPHSPYDPPGRFREQFAGDVADPSVGSHPALKALRSGTAASTPGVIRDLRALYTGDVAFNDHSFGQLIDTLKALGLYDDALIVILSDHGEGFREHRHWEHGKDVYGEVINVPMIVKFPASDGLRGVRVAAVVQQIDVMPTILEYLRLPIPPQVEGRSVLGLLDAENGSNDERLAYVHLHQIGRYQTSIIAYPWKLIRDTSRRGAARYELYDLATDPAERKNLGTQHPIIVGYLRGQLQMRQVQSRAALAPTMGVTDAVVEENLKALGYIE